MALISLDISKKDIFKIDTLLVALWTGILVTAMQFTLDFFGLNFLLSFVPEGFRLLVIVSISVFVSKKLVVKFRGREVI